MKRTEKWYLPVNQFVNGLIEPWGLVWRNWLSIHLRVNHKWCLRKQCGNILVIQMFHALNERADIMPRRGWRLSSARQNVSAASRKEVVNKFWNIHYLLTWHCLAAWLWARFYSLSAMARTNANSGDKCKWDHVSERNSHVGSSFAITSKAPVDSRGGAVESFWAKCFPYNRENKQQ